MDTATLRLRLSGILTEEERPIVDWDLVQTLCMNLYGDLDRHPDFDCPHVVYHFLSDTDIRQKDEDYGRNQRVEIKRFAETGECNNSKPASGPSCLLVALAAAAVAAVAIWWLNW